MAIQSVAGETLISYFTMVDYAGDPVTGETFTVVSAQRPDGDGFTAAVDEIGNGVYQITVETLETDPTGTWYVLVESSGGRQFAETWDIEAPHTGAGTIGTSSSPGVSRRDIRRVVAQMMGDFHEATDTVGGKTGQFWSPVALARESNHFKGMQILFSRESSPHYGTIATVSQSDGPTKTIYFEPPLDTPTIAGERIELYNFRGRGTTIAQYNATINAAISAARQQHALVPYREELTTPFMRTSPYIDIPQAFVSFSGVETVDRSGYRQHLKPGEYTVDRFSRSIEVRGRARDRLHGLTMTVRGYVMPALLDDDDDQTSIDLEWLYSEAKAQLLERMVASSLPVSSQDRLFLQEREDADGKRSMIINHVVPNTIRLN